MLTVKTMLKVQKLQGALRDSTSKPRPHVSGRRFLIRTRHLEIKEAKKKE